MEPTPEPVTDWQDEALPAFSPSGNPPRPWFTTLVVAGTCGWLGVAILLSRLSPTGGLIAAICSALVGLSVTMVAMAWGSAVVFADSTRRGLWFTLFPPYMVYYAIIRWRQMRDPTLLFLCGLLIAFVPVWVLSPTEHAATPAAISE